MLSLHRLYLSLYLPQRKKKDLEKGKGGGNASVIDGWDEATVKDTSKRLVVYARPFFNFMCTAVQANFKQ
jgi:hypothetical protein